MRIKLFYFVLQSFMYIAARSQSYNISKLRQVYYQSCSNHEAMRVQSHTECVVSRFSIAKPENNLSFVFQGIDDRRSIKKLTGELSPDKRTECFLMSTETNNDPHNDRFLCLLDYGPNLEWVLFSDVKHRFLFGMISDRFSATQKENVRRSMNMWTISDDVIERNVNCSFFTPP